ncbi:MAG: hypothetical protein ACRDO1_08645 [Nocardioidaceae bacterium]
MTGGEDERPYLLGVAQDGVVSRAQLDVLGVTRWRIRDEVRARRWRLVGRQCVVLHRGPLTREAKEWVAVLEHGQGAALAAHTAAARYGMTGFDSELVQIVVHRGARTRSFPWLKVHESRRFDPATDVHPARTPRIVSLERAIVDMACWSRSPRRACAILCAAVQQRLTVAPRLRDELDGAGRVRHHRLLRAVLTDIEGGSHALSELDMLALCRRAGLPEPRRQAVRRDAAGRRRYLDLEVVLADGTVLVIEVDGAAHLQPLTWWDDQLRQNLIVIDGSSVMRFPAAIARLDPGLVIDQLRQMAAHHVLAA